MSKSRKQQLIQELLQLEDDCVGDLGNTPELKPEPVKIPDTIDAVETDDQITKPKRSLTDKQKEALKKGQQKRDENRVKNKTAKMEKEEAEKKVLEEKLVKKAIALKKKQIKKQMILDEISDDDTELPLQKCREPKVPLRPLLTEPIKATGPIINFF